jgi:imidazolonepropionase-like amidohydrolase
VTIQLIDWRRSAGAALTLACLVACSGAAQESRAESEPWCSANATPHAERLRPGSMQTWPVQTQATAIVGATVFTATGEVFEPGDVIFEDGVISWVGPHSDDSPIPDGAEIIEAAGRFVTPGIIDTHSHLGVYAAPYYRAHSDGNEATSPITAEVEAVDSVWPQDPGFQRAMAGGITTLMILPGSANLIGGRGYTMKLRPGALHAEDLRFPGAPETLKMACGENPKRVYGDSSGPSTRMGEVAIMRQAMVQAREYLQSRRDHGDAVADWCEAGASEDERPDPPAVSLQTETLAGLMTGDIIAQIHCYRADEMLTHIALSDEFGYQIRSFHHAVEAYKIRDELAAHDISVSTWADWWGFKLEAYDAILENAAMIHAAGGRAVIHSDSDIGIQRLNQEAAKAYYAGLEAGLNISEDEAIQWITSNPAWTLGVQDFTGRLEPGLMADVTLWSAHPLSIYAQADQVFVDGVRYFDRANPSDTWSDFEAGQWPTTREAE